MLTPGPEVRYIVAVGEEWFCEGGLGKYVFNAIETRSLLVAQSIAAKFEDGIVYVKQTKYAQYVDVKDKSEWRQ